MYNIYNYPYNHLILKYLSYCCRWENIYNSKSLSTIISRF